MVRWAKPNQHHVIAGTVDRSLGVALTGGRRRTLLGQPTWHRVSRHIVRAGTSGTILRAEPVTVGLRTNFHDRRKRARSSNVVDRADKKPGADRESA
jgi:hypothetical protein